MCISLLLSKRIDAEDFMGQIGVECTAYVGPCYPLGSAASRENARFVDR